MALESLVDMRTGAWATLPAVIGGYIGNPWKAQPWIEDAMAQGSAQGRWPGTGLVVETGRGQCINQIFAARLQAARPRSRRERT